MNAQAHLYRAAVLQAVIDKLSSEDRRFCTDELLQSLPARLEADHRVVADALRQLLDEGWADVCMVRPPLGEMRREWLWKKTDFVPLVSVLR